MAPFRKVHVSFLCLLFYLQRLACQYILTYILIRNLPTPKIYTITIKYNKIRFQVLKKLPFRLPPPGNQSSTTSVITKSDLNFMILITQELNFNKCSVLNRTTLISSDRLPSTKKKMESLPFYRLFKLHCINIRAVSYVLVETRPTSARFSTSYKFLTLFQ